MSHPHCVLQLLLPSLLLLFSAWTQGHGAHGGQGRRQDAPEDSLTEHMRRLYSKYTRPGHQFKDGNTVRSYKAQWGRLDSRQLHIFNLTSLPVSESVLSATLHFFVSGDRPTRRRVQHRPPQLHVWSYGSPAGGAVGHARFNVSQQGAGQGAWQWRDVTRLVVDAAPVKGVDHHGNELLIAVEMESHKLELEPPYVLLFANDSAVTESVGHSLRHHHLPVMETALQDQKQDQNQRQNQGLKQRQDKNQVQRQNQSQSQLQQQFQDHIQNQLQNQNQSWDQNQNKLQSQNNNQSQNKPHKKLQDQNQSLFQKQLQKQFQNQHQNQSQKQLQNQLQEQKQLQNGSKMPPRHRRSVNLLSPLQNNELPEQYPGAGHYPGSQYPGAEQYPYNPSHWDKTEPVSPKDSQQNQRRMKKKSRKESKQKVGLLQFDERTMKKARRKWAEPRGCSRRYLKVDFADIGWSDWIISPKAYDAFYCAGSCQFPMNKALKPSNHATIQSIVRAVGVVPGVPEPCCVPEKMSSLSILFFDEQANVVLKVYPNMSVDSCACR